MTSHPRALDFYSPISYSISYAPSSSLVSIFSESESVSILKKRLSDDFVIRNASNWNRAENTTRIGNTTSSYILPPKPVGTLPLDHFIYYLIALLVIICCSVQILAVTRVLISPKRYLDSWGPLAHATDSLETVSTILTTSTARYRAVKPPAPSRVNSHTRDEVNRLRQQERYQGDGYTNSSLLIKPNLPIPIVTEKEVEPEVDEGINIGAIEAWGQLVEERQKLNLRIRNLERLSNPGNNPQGPINPKLLAALTRRAELENSINNGYERFRERRSEWGDDEWAVIETVRAHATT